MNTLSLAVAVAAAATICLAATLVVQDVAASSRETRATEATTARPLPRRCGEWPYFAAECVVHADGAPRVAAVRVIGLDATPIAVQAR